MQLESLFLVFMRHAACAGARTCCVSLRLLNIWNTYAQKLRKRLKRGISETRWIINYIATIVIISHYLKVKIIVYRNTSNHDIAYT